MVTYSLHLYSVFHSFQELMNSINWPALSVWILIAQLIEHFSTNAEAKDSSPVAYIAIQL